MSSQRCNLVNLDEVPGESLLGGPGPGGLAILGKTLGTKGGIGDPFLVVQVQGGLVKPLGETFGRGALGVPFPGISKTPVPDKGGRSWGGQGQSGGPLGILGPERGGWDFSFLPNFLGGSPGVVGTALARCWGPRAKGNGVVFGAWGPGWEGPYFGLNPKGRYSRVKWGPGEPNAGGIVWGNIQWGG